MKKVGAPLLIALASTGAIAIIWLLVERAMTPGLELAPDRAKIMTEALKLVASFVSASFSAYAMRRHDRQQLVEHARRSSGHQLSRILELQGAQRLLRLDPSVHRLRDEGFEQDSARRREFAEAVTSLQASVAYLWAALQSVALDADMVASTQWKQVQALNTAIDGYAAAPNERTGRSVIEALETIRRGRDASRT